MKRKWLTIFMVAAYLIAFSGVVYAWSSEIEGRPFKFQSGSGAKGYYLWKDEYGFHVWTLARGESHVFLGTIRTDGRFYRIRGHHLDTGESFQEYPDIENQFWFEKVKPIDTDRFVFTGLEVECGPHKIFFKFSTGQGADGIHFDVSDASYLSFDLLVDGHRAERTQIWYGGSSWHPETNVFNFENQ